MTDNIKLYSREQVSENNGKNGKPVWLIIKESIYDVTEYLDEHPGGGELLRDEAGKDATKGFNDFGHSGDATNIMKKLKIGELIEEDRKQKTKKGKKPTVKTVDETKTENTRSCLSIISCGCLM